MRKGSKRGLTNPQYDSGVERLGLGYIQASFDRKGYSKYFPTLYFILAS
jgi:hypothetical protein